MNRLRLFLLAALLLCLGLNAAAQGRVGVYAVAFYNLENLFDTEDDPANPGDDEFLPSGPYQWTEQKYRQKLHNIATVISQLAREHCPGGPAGEGATTWLRRSARHRSRAASRKRRRPRRSRRHRHL